MTGGKPTGEWLLTFLRENALTIVLGVAMAYGWFSSNNAALASKIAALETQVALLKKQARMNGKVREQINFLCTATPGCRTDYRRPIEEPEE